MQYVLETVDKIIVFSFHISFYLDTMDNWDEKKLEEVVNKKHGEAEKKKPKTQIVCPFLELSCCDIYH